MALQTIIAPVTTPLTLAEVKAHLRVTHTDEDSLIQIYSHAATATCENWMGRALVKRTYRLTVDSFNADGIVLPMPPLIEVLSVTYDDADGAEQTLVVGTDYFVDDANQPAWVLNIADWPTPMDTANAVRIEYTAGYVDDGLSPMVGLIPWDIKAAILLTVGKLYSTREDIVIGSTVVNIPNGAHELMRPHRVELGMA